MENIFEQIIEYARHAFEIVKGLGEIPSIFDGVLLISTFVTGLGFIKLRRRLKETPTIARGLAVGYYYNFLKLIITADKILVPVDPKQPTPPLIQPINGNYEFSKSQVSIEFLFSKHLNKDAGQKVAAQAEPSPNKKIELKDASGKSEWRTVNCDFVQRGSQIILLIRDPVRTYFAIYHYAEEAIQKNKKKKAWLKIEREILSEFREKVEELGGDNLKNRASWTPVE